LNTRTFLYSKRNNVRLSCLIEQLFHAFNSWVVKITKKKNLNVVHNLLLANNLIALMIKLFLINDWLFIHLNINERDNSLCQFVLRSFHNDDEFLALICTNLDRDLFL